MKDTILFTAIVLAAVVLHLLLQHNVFSIFLLPVGLSLMLPYIKPSSPIILLTLIVFFELFTTMPPGVITMAVVTPFLIRALASHTAADFSIRFFSLLTGTAWLQLTILTLLPLVLLSFKTGEWDYTLAQLPIVPLLSMAITIPIVSFIVITIWQEILLPDQATASAPVTLKTKRRS